MDTVKPPEQLQFAGNIRRNWQRFKQKLELFFAATPTKPPRTEATKTAILLSIAGEEALDIYNNFSTKMIPALQWKASPVFEVKGTTTARKWNFTTVSEQAAPRSCMVKTEDQRMLRRNRQHLLRIPGNGTSEDQDQDTESPEDMFDRDKSQDCNTPGEQAHRDQQGMVEPTITQGADHEDKEHFMRDTVEEGKCLCVEQSPKGAGTYAHAGDSELGQYSPLKSCSHTLEI
ncbi:hypothetical protein HPB52_015033 [Rhipicephalus sanguineus]|uniref:Uncharacterized protein n=1 Tax=Rhipicephalus sanguineus TaxID=34632 RepID=A0A9D4TAH6_RHISA|nr:hypothetical protein HPB52_015033 [Rhipicephalus sanguineus]